MKFRKAVKRMAALGTGAVMVGASIMGASAADLSNYPNQYIQDGKFTGVLVVGDSAAAEDVIGVSDIAISLQAAAVKPAGSGSSTTTVSGGWKVGTSTNQLEMSENLDSGNNRETIADITSSSFIDEGDFDLLAGGTASNSKGDAQYEERLYFEDATTGYVTYAQDDEDVTADFLYFQNGKQLARYELEFTTSLESDVDDSSGSASTTGLFLTDLEDIELTMLGRTYTVVTAKRVTTGGDSVILTLMGGATRDTLLEGNTKTYTIDGTDYEVTLNYVDSDEAQFTINGQTTRKLKDGDTDKLSDGTSVGVTDILYQDYAGGIHSATFFIGAQKLELKDTNITDSISSDEVEVDDETIDNADVFIEGTDDDTTFRIDKIAVNMTADDDYYVPAGGKLSENPELDEADLLFTRGWDIEYQGLSEESMNEIAVKAKGSDDYELAFSDGRGNLVSIPVGHGSATTTYKVGDNSDDFIVEEVNITNVGSITKDDYFIVTDESSDSNGERETYALRYRGSDASTDDNPTIKFDDLGSGDRMTRPLSVQTSVQHNITTPTDADGSLYEVSEIAQLKVGGGTFRVYNASSIKSDDFDIWVDMDGSGGLDSGVVSINTYDGAYINLSAPGTASADNALNVTISTPSSDDYDNKEPTPIAVELSGSATGEVDLATTGNDNHNHITPEDDEDNSYAYTSLGAFVRLYDPSSSPSELVVQYPSSQVLPQVFVTGEGASFTTSEVAEGSAVTVQRIDVGATKLASEVADITAVNSILVGGPCANAAAATVMGNPADCTAGFTPGVGKINMYDVGDDNVAMVVAGYSALDTRNAAQVVADHGDYDSQLTGDAVEVRKVNNQLTVAEPAEEEAMEEEEDSEEEASDDSEDTSEDDAEE